MFVKLRGCKWPKVNGGTEGYRLSPPELRVISPYIGPWLVVLHREFSRAEA